MKSSDSNNSNFFNSKLFFSNYHFPNMNINESQYLNLNYDLNLDNNLIQNFLSKELIESIEIKNEEKNRNNLNEKINEKLNPNSKYNNNFRYNLINPYIISNNNKQYKKTKIKNNKKNFVEREGDWTCFYCGNLNFSFRKNCNRCFSLRINSEIEHDKYMENLLYIINENEINRNLERES